MAIPHASVTAPHEAADQPIHAPGLQWFVFSLFFIFGGITSLNDVIIPKLRELFTLSYTEAMLVQFCFFTAYAVVGIPASRLVKRIGYMRGSVAGLLTMMAGCLLFIPAAQIAVYSLFLLALFVLASGIVLVQVVVNPLILLLGPPATMHSRLTFAQAFNSLGTTLFPYFGAILILGGLATVSANQLSGAELAAYQQAESRMIVNAYIGIALALAIVATVVWSFRNRLQGEKHEAASGFGGFDLLRRPQFAFGALCIFLYVGAEVAIGSIIVNYLMEPGVLGATEQEAGKLIPLYWGGAFIGRFIGAAVLQKVSPGKVLCAVALTAIGLIALSAWTTGTVSGYSLLAIGLANAIMFPTIFSLASEGLGARTADGSGIMNVAIFGGAVVPLLVGIIADASGDLTMGLIVPAVCYAIIAGFGIFVGRSRHASSGDIVPAASLPNTAS